MRASFRRLHLYATTTIKKHGLLAIAGGVASCTFVVAAASSTLSSKTGCKRNFGPFFRESLCDYDSSPLTRNFVADAVEAVSPSVVNILCQVDGIIGSGASTGSGFVVDCHGHIATNAHVVEFSAGREVIVTFSNGKKYRAKVHSMDKKSDIAIVKIENFEENPFPPVKLGVSSKVRAGEFVIAIGSPIFLQNSASLGIVSATARHASELGLSNSRSEYIQTDAAINVGNSGGPLVNLDGEVIGINTMKVKGVDGISFAIPIDIASQIIKQLIRTRKVVRPVVGLRMANVVVNSTGPSSSLSSVFRGRKKDKEKLFNTGETHVMVLDVAKDSPAYFSGLESGDVIVEVNEKIVNGVRDVLDAIGLEVGKSLEFRVRKRSGDIKSVRVITAPEK